MIIIIYLYKLQKIVSHTCMRLNCIGTTYVNPI